MGSGTGVLRGQKKEEWEKTTKAKPSTFHNRTVDFQRHSLRSTGLGSRINCMSVIDGVNGFLMGDDMGYCSFWQEEVAGSKRLHDGPITSLCMVSSVGDAFGSSRKSKSLSLIGLAGLDAEEKRQSGLTLFSGGAGGLRIWSVRHRPEVKFELLQETAIRWLPSDIQVDSVEKASKCFVAFSDSAEIQCYSASGKLLTTYYGHQQPGVHKLLMLRGPESENMFASAGADGTVRWWNMTAEQCGVPICWTKYPHSEHYARYFEAKELKVPERQILFVEVTRATNVPICDSWFAGGTSDPYVIVEIFHIDENNSRTLLNTGTSEVIIRNLNPFWGQTMDLEIPYDVSIDEVLIKMSMYDKDFLGSDDFIGFLEGPIQDAYEKGMRLTHNAESCVSQSLVEKCVVHWRAGRDVVVPGKFDKPDPTTTVAVTALAELPMSWGRVPVGYEDKMPTSWRIAVGFENGCIVIFERHGVDLLPKLRIDSDPLTVRSLSVWRDRIFAAGSAGFVREYDFLWRYLGRVKLHDGMIDCSIGLECGIFVLATYGAKLQTIMLTLWD